MRIQKFIGRITGYILIPFVLVSLIFFFQIMYTLVVTIQMAIKDTQDTTDINGIVAYAIACTLLVIFIFVSFFWLRKQWRESDLDRLPTSESIQLKIVINKLNSKLDKLDKLDKIDRLVKTIEKSEFNKTKRKK